VPKTIYYEALLAKLLHVDIKAHVKISKALNNTKKNSDISDSWS